MSSFIDWSKTTKSKDYRGSASFATFLIIGPTCFFLGILFASFPYDFPMLWSKEAVPASFYEQLEMHLRFMHNSPPLIGRVLNIMIFIGFLGLFVKLFRPSEANFLFDGASLILYVIGVAVYISNIVKGLRSLTAGVWEGDVNSATRQSEREGEYILGKEDSLRVLAASNTILALVLIGVLVLQAGQWYAEKRDWDEPEQTESKKRKETSPTGKTGSKKRQ